MKCGAQFPIFRWHYLHAKVQDHLGRTKAHIYTNVMAIELYRISVATGFDTPMQLESDQCVFDISTLIFVIIIAMF